MAIPLALRQRDDDGRCAHLCRVWCLVSARAGQRSSRTGDYGTRSRSRHARGGSRGAVACSARVRHARAARACGTGLLGSFVWLRRVRFVYVDRCTYFSDTRTSRSTRTHVEDPRERRSSPRAAARPDRDPRRTPDALQTATRQADSTSSADRPLQTPPGTYRTPQIASVLWVSPPPGRCHTASRIQRTRETKPLCPAAHLPS